MKNRLRSWLGSDAPSPAPTRARTIYGEGTPPKSLTQKLFDFRREQATSDSYSTAAQQSIDTLRASLMGMSAGWWASDHSEEAGHFTGWNYCAIHSKAKQSAQASVKVCRRVPITGPGSSTPSIHNQLRTKSSTNPDQPEYDLESVPADHPAAKLLAKPNPRWSPALWWYMLSQQANLTGSALIWTVLDRAGRPAEMWILPTALTRPQMPTPTMPEGAYWVTATGLFTMTGGYSPSTYGVGAAAGITIDARDVHPVRWPHPVLLADGQSPLAAGSVQIDLAEEIDAAAWAALHNEVDPSLILSIDVGMQTDPAELDRVESLINANRAGVNNKARAMLIQGVTPHQMRRAPSELDYANSRPATRDGVLAIHGVSPIFCGIAEAGSHAAFFSAMKQTIELSVQPELDIAASELTRLFQRMFGDPMLEVVVTAKSFDDPDVLERKRQTNVAAKSVTVNEDRAMQGLDPVWWGEVQVGTVIEPGMIEPKLKPEPPEQSGNVMGDGTDHEAFSPELTDVPEDDEADEMAESGQPDAATGSTTGMKRPELRRGMFSKPSMNGIKKSADMPLSIRHRLSAHMLNGLHKSSQFNEQDHPRSDDGKFGEGGGGGSGGSSVSAKPRSAPPKRQTHYERYINSPGGASKQFHRGMTKLAEAVLAGTVDTELIVPAVEKFIDHLSERLPHEVDAFDDAQIGKAREEFGDALDAEAFESHFEEFRKYLDGNAENLESAAVELRDAVYTFGEIENGNDTETDYEDARDAVRDQLKSFDTEKKKFDEYNADAVSIFQKSLQETFDEFEGVASDMAAELSDEENYEDSHSEDAIADAEISNERLEEAGNPFRLEWDEGSESWDWFVPEPKTEKSAKRLRRLRLKEQSRGQPENAGQFGPGGGGSAGEASKPSRESRSDNEGNGKGGPNPGVNVVLGEGVRDKDVATMKKRLGLTPEDCAALVGAQTGATVTIENIHSTSFWRGENKVIVHVKHPDYEASRTIYKDRIYNDTFKAVTPGSGIGTQVLGDQIDAAVGRGFKKLETLAVGRPGEMNGYYTWPRLGYDGKMQGDLGQRDIPALAAAKFPGATHVSHLMKTKEGREWWKQNGAGFEAEFDLTEGSLSRRVFDAYRTERAANSGR